MPDPAGGGPAAAEPTHRVVLVRHGETEWSRAGRHTGRSDIPLTDQGRADARCLHTALAGWSFEMVLASPLQRARQTCELAGCADRAVLRDELMEWDYGDYEGLTWPQIRERDPDWWLWRDGCPGGELPDDVGRRVDPVVADLRRAGTGDAVVFAHGHLLRVLAARWMERPPDHGARLALSTSAVCVLGFEHAVPGLRRWNDVSHLPPARRRS
jgi:probable phosphoglycerate mutase